MAGLSLALLGPLQVTLHGAPITAFESDKVRALLAYLAVEADRPHRRDALAGLLWPDRPERAAHLNLNQALANLRGAIGDRTATPPFLSITRETVQFNRASDYVLDVEAFIARLAACEKHPHRHPETCTSCIQRLRQAADLYRGSFLEQFFLSDSAAFEEWALLKREWLHRRALHTLARLADYHERRGNYEQAQHDTWRQLELEPWREESHRQLMRVLAVSGQRSAALEQYERCRRALADELGVEPEEETTTLYARIRDGEPRTENQEPRTKQPRYTPLPIPPTALIGRESELVELGALLENPACRLITIVGPGGIGKTRLALAAAAERSDTFAHGATFVPLQAISSAAFLAPAILGALGVTLQSQRDPREQLLDYLRAKELLLVLDNFEQLLALDASENDGGAVLLTEILQRAPGVTLLVTSRERLALPGEWLFDVPGLSYPAAEPTEGIEISNAAQLFLQRAGQVRRQFALADGEQRAVVRICQLVEGLPLAIELAAAALRTRSCIAIADAIETSLSALTSELRAIPERHRSMWAAFEHSWRLLSEEERQVFARLSVFRGGCTLEAAEAVCVQGKSQKVEGNKDDNAAPILPFAFSLLPLLTALVDKSLLRWDGMARYDMHELVRQYAGEKLEQAGAASDTRHQHEAYFLALAEEAEAQSRGPKQIAWIERLEVEHDNLRAALVWSERSSNIEVGLQLTGSLQWFWFLCGYLNEGWTWSEEALARSSGAISALRAKVLAGAGRLAQGDDLAKTHALYEESLLLLHKLGDSRAIAELLNDMAWLAYRRGDSTSRLTRSSESLALYRELDDAWGIASASFSLAGAESDHGDFEHAQKHLEESLALFRECGDIRGIGGALQALGAMARVRGDDERAVAFYEESLALFRRLGDRVSVEVQLSNLGYMAHRQGDLTRMESCFREGLVLSKEIGDQGDVAMHLGGLAGALGLTGCPELAAQLLGAADALLLALGQPRDWIDSSDHDRVVAAVRAQLGEATFAAAWFAGRAMTREQAIAYALEGSEIVSE